MRIDIAGDELELRDVLDSAAHPPRQCVPGWPSCYWRVPARQRRKSTSIGSRWTSVTSAPVCGLTRSPMLSFERPATPVNGARISVKSRLICALSIRGEGGLLGRRRSDHIRLRSLSISAVADVAVRRQLLATLEISIGIVRRAACAFESSAFADARAARYGRGSMRYIRAPASISWPSSKLRSMMLAGDARLDSPCPRWARVRATNSKENATGALCRLRDIRRRVAAGPVVPRVRHRRPAKAADVRTRGPESRSHGCFQQGKLRNHIV